ncbi:MAG: AraC family transcriptional regulator [Dysgonamonadaceae bacterium]|jgi:AraC-like DNA-binding protein|nr:AraC family transcriptional regulator [Dysgonamonadaceae bacterium]
MENKIYIKNLADLFSCNVKTGDIENKIKCLTIDSKVVNSQFPYPMYLNAFVGILVLSGTANANINYKNYFIEANMIVLLTVSHLFSFNNCSADFKCRCLFVSKEFMEDMDATDMIYRRIKYGARLYSRPVLKIESSTDVALLNERMIAIDKSIGNTNHHFHKEMILNNLFAFYLDLSNVIESKANNKDNDTNLSQYENIIKLFIELLVANYRKEHKVEFYASKLNMTPHYLTFIVKRITGQTVTDFVFEMLYSEARNLLTHSRLSMQEIALQLNFSDQSSFGKFFKRKAGISPLVFRGK